MPILDRSDGSRLTKSRNIQYIYIDLIENPPINQYAIYDGTFQ